jgi:hypothetical protein
MPNSLRTLRALMSGTLIEPSRVPLSGRQEPSRRSNWRLGRRDCIVHCLCRAGLPYFIHGRRYGVPASQTRRLCGFFVFRSRRRRDLKEKLARAARGILAKSGLTGNGFEGSGFLVAALESEATNRDTFFGRGNLPRDLISIKQSRICLLVPLNTR